MLHEITPLSFEENQKFIDQNEIEHHIIQIKHPGQRFLLFLLFIAITYSFVYLPPFVLQEEGNVIPSYMLNILSQFSQIYNGAVLIAVPLFIASFFLLKGPRIYFSLFTRFIFLFIGLFTMSGIWLTSILFILTGNGSYFIFPFFLVVFFIFLGNGLYELSREKQEEKKDEGDEKRQLETFRSPLEFFFYEASHILTTHYVLFPLVLFLEGFCSSASGTTQPDFMVQILSFLIAMGMLWLEKGNIYSHLIIDTLYNLFLKSYYLFRYMDEYRAYYHYSIQTWYGTSSAVYKEKMTQLNQLLSQEQELLAENPDLIEIVQKDTQRKSKPSDLPTVGGFFSRGWGPLLIIAGIYGAFALLMLLVDYLIYRPFGHLAGFSWLLTLASYFGLDELLVLLFIVGMTLACRYVYIAYRESVFARSRKMTRGSKRFLQNDGKTRKEIPYSDSYLDVAWMLEEIK